MTDFTSYLHADRLAIFLVHGVTRASGYDIRNYTGKNMDAEAFEALIASLVKHGNAVSLDEVIACRDAGDRLPPRAFALTFDDGFENNYSVAAPILRKYDVSATIYVTTGWTEVNGMSWIDRVEYCFETTASANLQLPWHRGSVIINDRASKITVLDEIRQNVKGDPELNVDRFVEDVFNQCGKTTVVTSSDELDRKLSWDQLRELAGDQLFTIGGHTHTHRIMAYLSSEELVEEIDTCLGLLLTKAGIKTHHFSYPEGTANSYNAEVVTALRARGIVCSPAVLGGTNDGSESLFDLKRIIVA